MTRPYISGPMSGYEFHNFEAFFEAEERMRRVGYDPINPARHGVGTNTIEFADWREAYGHSVMFPARWDEYLKADIALVLESDSIVLLPGWEKSKGACLELVISVSVGNSVWRYVPPISEAVLHLQPVVRYDLTETYNTALRHLAGCGLGGVGLPENDESKAQ